MLTIKCLRKGCLVKKFLYSKEGKYLTGLIFIGLIIRLWGLDHGFPFIFHPDEPAVVRSATGIRFNPNPAHFDWPHLYFYLNYIVYFVFIKFRGLLQILNLRGVLEPIIPLFWRDPLVFYFISRLLSAFMGALTAIPLYFSGKKLVSKKVGYLSAFAILFMPGHVYTSHFALIDVPTAFFVSWVIYFSIKIFKREGNLILNYVWAGLFLGLSASTKYHGGLYVASILTAHVLSLRFAGKKRTLGVVLESILDVSSLKKLALSSLVSVLGFVLGTPYALLDFDTFIRSDSPVGALWQFKNVGSVSFTKHLIQFAGALSFRFANDFGYVFIAFYVLFLIYCLIKRKDKMGWLLAVPSLFMFYYISGFDKLRSHYLIVVYPFVAIVFGYFTNIVLGWSKNKKHIKVLLTSLLAIPVFLSFYNVFLISRKDTKVQLYDWMVQNIRDEDHIIYNSSSLDPVMRKFNSDMVHKDINQDNTYGREGYIIVYKESKKSNSGLVFGALKEVLSISGEKRRGEGIVVYEF